MTDQDWSAPAAAPSYQTQEDDGFDIGSELGSSMFPPVVDAAAMQLNNLETRMRFVETQFRTWPEEECKAFRQELMHSYFNNLYQAFNLGPRAPAPAPPPRDPPTVQPRQSTSQPPPSTSSFMLRGSQLDQALQERLTNSAAETLMNALTGRIPQMPPPPLAPIRTGGWNPGNGDGNATGTRWEHDPTTGLTSSFARSDAWD